MWIAFSSLWGLEYMVDDPRSSALIIKAQAPVEAPAHVHLAIMMNWWPMGKSSPVCLPRAQNQRASDNTCKRINAALSCRAIIHLEMVMSDATVGHPGLWVDLEYHAVTHRELRDNGSRRFRLETDWLDNILIPVSWDNRSKNGLRRIPSTRTAFPPAQERSTACRGSRATSLLQWRREPSVCLRKSPRELQIPWLCLSKWLKQGWTEHFHSSFADFVCETVKGRRKQRLSHRHLWEPGSKVSHPVCLTAGLLCLHSLSQGITELWLFA